MLYIAYLDEFGHIGPFINRNHAKHNDSPIFGLAGVVLPYNQVRPFATWFFQLKCNLLKFEILRDNVHAAQWEKKGSTLFTTKNIEKYAELKKATNRILNRIEKVGGRIIFVGLQKTHSPETHDPEALYRAVLMETIKRLNQYCESVDASLLVILDEQADKLREKIVEASGRTMFGDDGRKRLIEPPIQAESHLYQTLQCADWICGLIGRLGCNFALPDEYGDFEWAEKYFGDRIRKVSPGSGIRRQPRV